MYYGGWTSAGIAIRTVAFARSAPIMMDSMFLIVEVSDGQ
jgi:hypothetical protein